MNVKTQKNNEPGHFKRNARAYGFGTAVGAFALAAILAARCGDKAGNIPCPEPCLTETIQPVRADGFCAGLKEADPSSACYSIEDCHNGDNRCQKDKDKVMKPNDVLVTDLMPAYTDGTPVPSPLEDDKSLDCIMHAIKDSPCGPVDTTPEISRPLVRVPPGSVRQLTAEERQAVQDYEKAGGKAPAPDILKYGPYEFSVPTMYEETFNPKDPVCKPPYLEKCYCANHTTVKPKNCGNGIIEPEKGEQCDTRSKVARGGCADSNHVCSNACTCGERVKKKFECRDGTVTPPFEDCEQDNDCNANQQCNGDCKCIGKKQEPKCGNDLVEAGEDCEANDQCGSNQECKKCNCVEKPKPPPTKAGPCNDSIKIGDYRKMVTLSNSALAGALDPLRGEGASGTVILDREVLVDSEGKLVKILKTTMKDCGPGCKVEPGTLMDVPFSLSGKVGDPGDSDCVMKFESRSVVK